MQRSGGGTPSTTQSSPPNLPQPGWRGWKQQTMPTVADVERSRGPRPSEYESEMPDAELKEAMARSLQEMRYDPMEVPCTGGSSGSGGATALPQNMTQGGTPTTQSEGESSVLGVSNPPPRLHFEGAAQPVAPSVIDLHSQQLINIKCWQIEQRENQR